VMASLPPRSPVKPPVVVRQKTRQKSTATKATKAAKAQSDLNALRSSQKATGDFTDWKLKKHDFVWLDMKLEGQEKLAAKGQAYISVGRCTVVDPSPLMYCPKKEGAPNTVADCHDFTTVTFDQLTCHDDYWLSTPLGPLDVFLPLPTKDLPMGFPSIENEEERTVKFLFEAMKVFTGSSGVESYRKQVSFHLLLLCFARSHFIPPLGVHYLHRLPEYHQSQRTGADQGQNRSQGQRQARQARNHAADRHEAEEEPEEPEKDEEGVQIAHAPPPPSLYTAG
jgi:hypothetical protein